MLLCTNCLHLDDRKVEHCPSCGAHAFADVRSDGSLVTVPADAGMPCSGCLDVENQLKLRYYRRVVAMFFADRISASSGYFCASCRRREFARHMLLTLLLGWWGFAALLFRNPYAIVVNLWALFAPPFGAGEMGAMNVNEIRKDADGAHREEQRLADIYMQMPGWMDTLTENDVRRILMNVDRYQVLGVAVTASHVQIKSAWRTQALANHPDRTGAVGHERMVAINEAWEILGDERLRHAYDHREELVAFLQSVGPDATEADDDRDYSSMTMACRVCHIGFDSFDEAADHADEVHPNVDYVDVLVSVEPDEGSPGPTTDAAPAWRCKACHLMFDDHAAAVEHADVAHPDRMSINPNAAVEAV